MRLEIIFKHDNDNANNNENDNANESFLNTDTKVERTKKYSKYIQSVKR